MTREHKAARLKKKKRRMRHGDFSVFGVVPIDWCGVRTEPIMTNPKEVTIPVRHWSEDEFFSEPDEEGRRIGQVPMFFTASCGTMTHNNEEVVRFSANMGGSVIRVDINIEGNKHAFVIDALDFLPIMLDSIGETELANLVRDMGDG